MPPSIYDFIKAEENRFESEQVQVGQNWSWNFKNHVQMIFHLKNGVFFTGNNDWMRAFKNIMEPMLNLSYVMEDIELKDVAFYVENDPDKVLSFLIKKYHDEIYVKENDLDTVFDEITESDVDYGGVLVQKTNTKKPEVLALNSLAFCDQTDLLGGPLAFKMFFSPGKLREMSKLGWGSEANGATTSIEDLITLATFEKDSVGNDKKNTVPGKTIEVYILRGNLPENYLFDNDNIEDYYNQVQIVAFYVDKNSKKQGVTLYRKKEKEGNLKFHTSQKVYGRALGRGIGEAQLHPQVWTNWLTIHKHNLLEAGSKVTLYTDDPSYANKNKIQDMDNLEISTIEDGKRIYQTPTIAPTNIQLYEGSINEWYQQAQLTGSAFDPLLGKEATSGTTFRGQNQVVQQGKGSHDRRKGQRSKFIEELYRDWIVPDMIKGIVNGTTFLATLSNEEMQWVSERLAENYATKVHIEEILNGQEPTDREVLKQKFIKDFSKKGGTHLLEILKDETRDIAMRIGINVANKQKDLSMLSDKVLSIFQFIFANPAGFLQAMKIPALSKSFSDILEFSGLSIADFASLTNAQIPTDTTSQQVPQNTAQPSPQQLIPQQANA